MEGDYGLPSEEGSDYSYSDSDSDDFYNGYCEKPSKVLSDFVSLPHLRNEYNENMEMEKKQQLFLYAADEEDIPFLQTLLRDRVPIDSTGVDGWTALMKACLNGKPNVVEFLLSNGSNPNFQADLFTPIMACCTFSCAAEEKKCECLDLLITYHGSVNACDKHKSTPLMHAASSGYLNIVNRLLVVHDIDIHAQDFDGWNAVFHAVSNNRISVVKRLIQRGLQYKIMDSVGRTAVGLAEERGYRHLSILLTRYENKGVVTESTPSEDDIYAELLKELPGEDGEGGFVSDTNEILRFYNSNKRKNIGFADFLNMREDDLLEAGVKLGAHRRHILRKIIHKFHLAPWTKFSMAAINKGIPMALEEGICILGSVVKHLTLIKASLRYVNTRINERKTELNETLEMEAVTALVLCYDANEIMREKLHTILEFQDSVNPIEVEDLIVKPPEESEVKPTFNYGLKILGATTAGYLIFHFVLKFGCFVKQLTFGRK